ncbi:MAG: polyprenyl synthetase family protein, partial [Myxococcales bacterium]|nr:polyprenyl synthetase family protein [Myxococcales bacterium]
RGRFALVFARCALLYQRDIPMHLEPKESKMELAQYLEQKKATIDAALLELVSSTGAGHGGACGDALERLAESMRYTLALDGKRLRPILTLAAAEALGVDEQTVLPAACAMEAIHVFSLIQDDMPALDNDDLRRGKPSNHKVFGEAIALLASDALLNAAYRWVSESCRRAALEAPNALDCLDLVTDAIGEAGLIGGQAIDLLTEKRSDLLEADLHTIHAMKTGALIALSLEVGARLGRAAPETLARFREYGRLIGLAFQVVDDILDNTESTEVLGKPAGSDARRERGTYYSLLGEAGARARANELVARAKETVALLGAHAERFHALADFIVDRHF